ncbi:MAG: hypothetical protein D4R65_07530 [Verrucomicrobiaceae bacterium]|nr:MAG: hypothetical protein D4R65_07530 [Verrucomicrobiaceae bacterium]
MKILPHPTRAFRILSAAALVFCTALPSGAQLPPVNPPREWALTDGNVSAALDTFDGRTVVLRFPNGQRKSVPSESLGEADASYLAEWQEKQPVVMPDSAGVDISKIQVEVISEDEKESKFVYRTQNFEFTCEGKLTQALLRDVARNFEATYELVKALPWGIVPEPEEGDRFRALLVRSKVHYEEQGGPKNSGGFYSGARKMFIIPFENLGIKPLGKSYTKASDYNSDTLVHELTHQMMHSSLNLLPPWITEGTAEYTNSLPLRLGMFRVSAAKTGLKDYVNSMKTRKGGVPNPYPIDKMFEITPEEWNATLEKTPEASHRMYFTAFLLVNYFMHMDGKGDGALFVKYMRTIARARQQIEDFKSERKAFKQKSGESGKAARPQRPDILASPENRAEFEKSTLEILLNGRTTDELTKQIRNAYRRYGVDL